MLLRQSCGSDFLPKYSTCGFWILSRLFRLHPVYPVWRRPLQSVLVCSNEYVEHIIRCSQAKPVETDSAAAGAQADKIAKKWSQRRALMSKSLDRSVVYAVF